MKESLFIGKSGTLRRKDNTIQIVFEDNVKKDIPIEKYDNIYFLGEITVNTHLLSYITHFGISLHFFNHYGFYIGSYYPKDAHVSGQLLVKQVEHYSDNEKRLKIAQKFIEAGSFNIYRNLRYYNGRGKDLSLYMSKIEELRSHIFDTKSIEELMGYEGNIRQIYYSSWKVIINQEIDFEKRVMHPPDNAINSLISYINTLVYTSTLGEIYKTSLNPTISYLHQPSERRFSLCLDISEIFKPLLTDRLIFSLLNRNQITEKDFEKGLNFTYINKNAKSVITKAFDNRMHETINHKDLGKNVSYQYLIRLECYKLIKHLYGEKEYDGFKIWW